MSKPDETRLSQLEQQCLADSQKWFGDQQASRSLVHMSLAMAGEVGEFCNVVKKVDRGSLDYKDAATRHKLAMELTDVFVYLLNIAGMMGIDLEKSYQVVRANNNARFMEQREVREALKKMAEATPTAPQSVPKMKG